MLSRENPAMAFPLPAGASASYLVAYQPRLQGGKPSPWLVRMSFSVPGSAPNSIGFTWLDQTDPNIPGSTAGSSGRSASPKVGGNPTDVPGGTDTSAIQQAVLSAASPGTFLIALNNGSGVKANYVLLQLLPLLGASLEPWASLNPLPLGCQPPAGGGQQPGAGLGGVFAASESSAVAESPASVDATLDRQNPAADGILDGGGSARYSVSYQPRLEAFGKPAPWLLRLTFNAPGAPPGSIGFTWLDQTDPNPRGTTAGSSGRSVSPGVGGNATDAPVGTDRAAIQQAVLSAAGPGSFTITVMNGSKVRASYTLHMIPLLGGLPEPMAPAEVIPSKGSGRGSWSRSCAL